MPSTLKILSVKALPVVVCFTLLLGCLNSAAQVCSDPSNVIYGLTNGGFIHPIDVNTGVVGSAINPSYPGNAPDQSNGLAYNGVNGRFYYFNRIPSSTIIEFVSFDPSTNNYTVLASPATTSSVYSGSITSDGTGYYCWDTQGRLFYYNIPSDTWTTITTTLVDQFGKDVDSIIRAHGSGDGAIDGYGNLWILPSSNTMYGLFRLNGPLPTTVVASITVEQVVAMVAPPAKFVGISFTATGQIFMCTSTDKMYRLEDNATLTLMSTMTLNMGDLTSCNFPLAILASEDYDLKATDVNGQVKLTWNPSQQSGAFTYFVERSSDNKNWKTISKANDLNFSANRISFIDASPSGGRNFYRVKVQSTRGNKYSAVRIIDLEREVLFTVWPNPVANDLFIRNAEENALVTIFNESGSKVKAARISNGINNIDLKPLPTGRYFLTVRTSDGVNVTYKIIKR
jgi:hypothetical protein